METVSKDADKTKQSDAPEKKLFVHSGYTEDEITIVTAGDKTLFASKGFLVYNSPVFEKMFTSNFKEKNTSTIKMEEDKYEAILDFLKALHAREEAPVTEENVFTLTRLADKYDVKSLLKQCCTLMKKMVEKNCYSYDRDEKRKEMLDIFTVIDKYQLGDMGEDLIVVVGQRIDSRIYRKMDAYRRLSLKGRLMICEARLRTLEP